MYKLILILTFLSFNLYSKNNLVVYMSPTCGCCTYWVKHMQENGFSVETVKINNVDSIKIVNKISPEEPNESDIFGKYWEKHGR